ncbi:MAG: hypothetical protein PWQ97_716 [Tepidanaerobacteraceae bacterium]|nr:hypothetical protein [Tepidanaerobacteraceae bacterium]
MYVTLMQKLRLLMGCLRAKKVTSKTRTHAAYYERERADRIRPLFVLLFYCAELYRKGVVFMDKVVFTITLALIGGFIGNELKIPAGALLGAMVFVGAANILGVKPEMPESFNTIAQIVLGGFLGLSITKEVVADLKDYIIPSLMVVVILAIFGIFTGMLVSKITGMELYTSLFGSVPGGMQEMIVLSESYDVNHPAVVVIQTVRRVLIVVIYPLLVFILSKYTGYPLNTISK